MSAETHSARVRLLTKESGRSLGPLALVQPGQIASVDGIALASRLRCREVADRMARTCEDRLTEAGWSCRIQWVGDTNAQHPGASLAFSVRTSTGGRQGRRPSALIGGIGEHDQLVLFAVLADGTSRYVVPGSLSTSA